MYILDSRPRRREPVNVVHSRQLCENGNAATASGTRVRILIGE